MKKKTLIHTEVDYKDIIIYRKIHGFRRCTHIHVAGNGGVVYLIAWHQRNIFKIKYHNFICKFYYKKHTDKLLQGSFIDFDSSSMFVICILLLNIVWILEYGLFFCFDSVVLER